MSLPQVSFMSGLAGRLAFAMRSLPLLSLIGSISSSCLVPRVVLGAEIFHPTAAQRADLGFAVVQSIPYAPQEHAEGALAYDEDAQTPVLSPYSGRVLKILAQPGDHVKAGAPMLVVAATEVAQAQSDLISARDALNTARAQLQVAIANEARFQGLYQAKTAALKDWLQSQADRVVAQNAENAAQGALNAVRNRLHILGQSNAEIAALIHGTGNRSVAPESLVRAPIAGTVIQRQVGVGQFITSAAMGATSPLYVVTGSASLWVIAYVRESDVLNIHLGQPAIVRLPSLPGRTFAAKVEWIASSLDGSTHRLPIRAEIANPDGALKAGMFASMSIATAAPRPTLFVPGNAIIQEENRKVVCVEAPDGSLTLRAVTEGDATTDQGLVEVTHGLVAGQRVVTRGAIFIEQAIATANNPS